MVGQNEFPKIAAIEGCARLDRCRREPIYAVSGITGQVAERLHERPDLLALNLAAQFVGDSALSSSGA